MLELEKLLRDLQRSYLCVAVVGNRDLGAWCVWNRVEIPFSFFKHVQTVPGDRISDRRYDDSCSGMNGGSAEAIEGLERLWEEMLQIASNILTDY